MPGTSLENKSLAVGNRRVVVCFCFVLMALTTGCVGGSNSPIITPSEALVSPNQKVQFTARAADGPRVWLVNGIPGGAPSTGTINAIGMYTAPEVPNLASFHTAIRVGVIVNGVESFSVPVSLFLPGKFTPGTVSSTANALVASYSIPAPIGASVQIQFGSGTDYGLTTWSQPAPASGGKVSILVAGMRASSIYHMRAVIKLADGTQAVDADHVFTTEPLPASRLPAVTVQQFANQPPHSGVELLALLPGMGNQFTAVATDLSGNVIWYYDMTPGEWPFPIKLLRNGHFLLVASTGGFGTPGATNEVREIDLAGTVINRITTNQVNSALISKGASPLAVNFHHDILKLPSDHMIFLLQYSKPFNLPGLAPGTQIIGDALIDWDPQERLPVWTWSTFDHLDINHAPFGYPDWTHANAIVYSPNDGNLILSMRNQDWIIKINYRDGRGDGSILWRLGPGGDFTLPTSQAPIEFNYGQHNPHLLEPRTAGIYPIIFFNNGNNRLVDGNDDVCGSGAVNCYSSVPIMELNEYTKTAQILWESKLSAYSICCGDALRLPNGEVEYDVAFDVHTPGVSYIQEVTQEQNPQLLWQMNIAGQLAYRGFRIASLYPGVQW
jgi:arylsulfate sulfotransferase